MTGTSTCISDTSTTDVRLMAVMFRSWWAADRTRTALPAPVRAVRPAASQGAAVQDEDHAEDHGADPPNRQNEITRAEGVGRRNQHRPGAEHHGAEADEGDAVALGDRLDVEAAAHRLRLRPGGEHGVLLGDHAAGPAGERIAPATPRR